MRRAATITCWLYLLLLTAALLAANPFRVAGSRESAFRELYHRWVQPVAHGVAFTPLGFLAAASVWPPRWFTRMGLLVLYAVGSETLQAWFPPRTPELADLGQDLLGGVLGAAAWWVLVARRRARRAGSPAEE